MRRSRMQGLTLVELMVAMVLGLVVIGGAVSLTLANRQSFRTSEGLSQVQESARTAFELIARDVRQADVTGCDNEKRITNVLDTASGTLWWMGWFGARGFEGDEDSAVDFGTSHSERLAGTDSIQLQGIQNAALTMEDHDHLAGTIDINAGATDIVVGDVIVACDFDHAAIFQVTAYNAAPPRLTYNTGALTPGNCTTDLAFPLNCASTINGYQFPRNSQLGRFFATEWYVGATERDAEGGSALFRRRVGSAGNEFTEEIVSGVTDMQILYRVADNSEFLPADAIPTAAEWEDVNAVRIALTVDSADTRVSSNLDTNDGRLQRVFTQVITLRNRVP